MWDPMGGALARSSSRLLSSSQVWRFVSVSNLSGKITANKFGVSVYSFFSSFMDKIMKEIAGKLRIIILLRFELVTFRFAYGIGRKLQVS